MIPRGCVSLQLPQKACIESVVVKAALVVFAEEFVAVVRDQLVDGVAYGSGNLRCPSVTHDRMITFFGSRVSGFGLRVSGFEFQVSGFRFRISSLGLGVSGFVFRVSGFGFRVSGFGF